MKAILKFDLPEDIVEFHSAVNGGDAIAVISEIDNYLRTKIKHSEDSSVAIYQAIREELRRLLEEYEISID